MLTPILPKDVWKHIRSFSGPNEATPAAQIIKESIRVIDDVYGRFQFPEFGRDGYASTIVLAMSPVFFEK